MFFKGSVDFCQSDLFRKGVATVNRSTNVHGADVAPLASLEADGILPRWVGEKPIFLRNKTSVLMMVLISIRG